MCMAFIFQKPVISKSVRDFIGILDVLSFVDFFAVDRRRNQPTVRYLSSIKANFYFVRQHL